MSHGLGEVGELMLVSSLLCLLVCPCFLHDSSIICSNPQGKRKIKPFSVLNFLFTTPSYRHKGIGSQLVRWGTQEADHQGLECWTEATDIDRSVYEKNDFILIEDVLIELEQPDNLTEVEQTE
jgi:GNAT superfamily N-acetyltransferase